jgi:hypothetical protein
MGPNPLKILIPFVSYPPIRPVFVKNTAFNAQLSIGEHAQTPATESIAEAVEPYAEHAQADTDAQEAPGSDVRVEETEHTKTPANHLLFLQDKAPPEHAQTEGSELEEAAQSHAIETVASELVGETLGIDSHAVEAVLQALEVADENTSNQPAVEPISTVAVPEPNTPKRIKVRRRNPSNQAQPSEMQGESCL